jgi:hypothetical protein
LLLASLAWVECGAWSVARAAEKTPAKADTAEKVDKTDKPEKAPKPAGGGERSGRGPRKGKDKDKGPTGVSPVVQACVDQHTSSQELRMEGKLLESRDAMLECAAEACPALLQRDCVNWIDELRTQIPSLTFRVTLDGQSRTDAQIYIDGEVAHEPASGKAVDVNPGRHRIRVAFPGVPAFEEEVVLSEGERYRLVEITLTSPPSEPPPRPEMHRPVPVATWVLGGIAVVSTINASIWGASSVSLRKELEEDCAPNCTDQRVDTLRKRALIADVSWGVSALSAIGATTFFLLRPEVPVEVDVAWLPGGAFGMVRVEGF